MKTYLVGRSTKVDITLTDNDRTVSNRHLEITEDTEGKYYVVDCNSTNGTFQAQNGQWVQIKQAYVNLDEPLLLGKYQTTVRQLLDIPAQSPAATSQPEAGSVERNPETGDIIPRRG